jgi:hypothetical protein
VHDRTPAATRRGVKVRAPRPIHPGVETVPTTPSPAVGVAWALSLLSALSSAGFAAGAVAGWTMHLWPATPVTFGIAAAVVIAGPLASALLLHGIRATEPAAPAPTPARRVAALAAPPVAPLPGPTPGQAFGHALQEWRDQPLRRGS